MTLTQILALLSVAQDLIATGRASYEAVKAALIGLGATPEQFDQAEATLADISARRRAIAEGQ